MTSQDTNKEQQEVTLEEQIELAILDARAARISLPTRMISPEAERRFETRTAILASLQKLRECERDAARYRWLRSPDSGIDAISHRTPISNTGATCVTLLEGDKLDAALDQAQQSIGEK